MLDHACKKHNTVPILSSEVDPLGGWFGGVRANSSSTSLDSDPALREGVSEDVL